MKEQIKSLLTNPQCDYLEIRTENTARTSFRYMGDQLHEIQQDRSAGAAIRALVKGRWGFVTINDVQKLDKGVADAVESATLAASLSEGTHQLADAEPNEVDIPLQVENDPREISLNDKLETFGRYNEQVLSGKGITSSLAYYFDNHRELVFANSEGSYISRENIDLACSIRPYATRDGETRGVGVSQGSSNDFNVVHGLEQEINKAIAASTETLDAPVIEAGNYTVICDPNLAGVFIHEAFGHLSEGDNVANDERMREIMKLGRQFGGDFLNVHDTGLDVGLRGYLPYDDEGVATQRTELIHEGRLVGRLHNRETAGKLGEKPTGSARAITYRFAPIPRMRNTTIGAGPHGSFEDLIKDVKLGVYAMDASGGQTNGELFTFTAQQAFMIRDGKVAERVKDVTISGNVFETLKNINGVGSDFNIRDSAGGCGKAGQMPLPVSHGSPHIRIANCLIGGQ